MRAGFLRGARMYRGICIALVGGMVMAWGLAPAAPVQQDVHASPPEGAVAAGSARMPATLLPRVNASVARDDPAYAVAPLPDDPRTLWARSPASGIATAFTPDGITFAGSGAMRWSLRLVATNLGEVSPSVPPRATGGRVEYRRGGWWSGT
jgi:hypothetical protein